MYTIEADRGKFTFNASRHWQPVKGTKMMSDMVLPGHLHNYPCCAVLNLLQTFNEIDMRSIQNKIVVVQPKQNECRDKSSCRLDCEKVALPMCHHISTSDPDINTEDSPTARASANPCDVGQAHRNSNKVYVQLYGQAQQSLYVPEWVSKHFGNQHFFLMYEGQVEVMGENFPVRMPGGLLYK